MAFGDEAVAAGAPGEGDGVGCDGGDDSGEGGDALAGLREELDGALGRVAVDAGVDGHHEDAVRAEADVDAGGRLQAAEEEAGGAEEDERHGDLRYQEDVAQAEATAGAGEGVFAFEGVGEDGAGGDPGWDEAKEKAGGCAEEEDVEKDSPVDRDGEVEWDGCGKAETGEATGCGVGEEGPEDSSA